jgi:hypothetical protein
VSDRPLPWPERFLPLLALLDDVRVAGLHYGASLSWHLPSDMIPGAVEIYGVPVVRYGGPPALALSPPAPFPPDPRGEPQSAVRPTPPPDRS